MIYWQSVDIVNIFYQLQAHRTPYSSIPILYSFLHEKFVQTNTAKCVATMNQNPWNVILSIVVFFT